MKKLLFSTALTTILMSGNLVWAQTSPEDMHYQNGRLLVDQKKYELAMAELLPLTNTAANTPRAADASYLYAVAASRAGKTAEANTMLQQLTAKFPDWGNMEEAYYLMAKLAFDAKNYEKAITNLQFISSEFIKPDAVNLERSYLMALPDKNRFKSLLNQFPDDATLANVYLDKLKAGWYADDDKPTFESLVAKFKFDGSVYNLETVAKNRKKSEYNIALLLPFQTNTDLATARKNQLATDLYAGMKLAQDSLAKNNVKLNLFTYEAGTDTAAVRKTLQLPELKTMDLVIGPVYKSSAKQAGKFATATKINVINPLSEDLEVVNGNANLFVFNSSIITCSKIADYFAFDNFELKIAAIVFENTKEDTLFARAYRKQFELRGGKIKLYKKINTKKNPNVMPIFQNVDLTTFGHLLMVSDNLPAAVATISQVESQNGKLPVMAKESWLEMPQLSLSQLDVLEIYFIHPNYRNNTLPAAKHFRKNYLSLFNIPPSDYAYSGFEMLLYFGNQLNAYGSQFQTFLPTSGTVSGAFRPGLGYETAHDNQFVPILKVENQQLELVNPVIK
jgi:ABC-type branched-subunit amino acid transport system substrate-binding protein